MNTIEKLFKSAPSEEEFAEGYLTYLVELLNRIDVTEISKFINIICQAQKRGARIFFIGNGGRVRQQQAILPMISVLEAVLGTTQLKQLL